MNNKKVYLTGVKPTGSIHLGNYISAIKEITKIDSKTNDVYLFVADLHALTTLSNLESYNAKETIFSIRSVVASYIALGVDPKKVYIYQQSKFPQVTELAWLYFCSINHKYLSIGHAYKDMVQNNKDVGLGVYLYPGLMAADITLLNADYVPVGKDQQQHIEIAREFVKKINNKIGKEIINTPKEIIVNNEQVPGTDGRKMSKSYNNTLPIFGDEDYIRSQIRSIKTDSTPIGEPIPNDNIICSILKLVITKEEYSDIKKKCSLGTISYKELKEMLEEVYFEYFKDARKKYKNLMDNPKSIDKILLQNEKKIKKQMDENLDKIKRALGLLN